MSHGTKESSRLKINCEEQLERLLTQLKDLDEMRDELEPEEYESSKEDTMSQVLEFQKTLDKLVAGDVTLVSSFGSMQLAVREAILAGQQDRDGLKKTFESKSTSGLRSKLASLEQDLKLGRIQTDAFNSLAVDVIVALEKLGEPLSMREKELLERSKNLASGFEKAASEGDAIGERVVEAAKGGGM